MKNLVVNEMNAKNLRHRGEIYNRFMSSGEFDKNSNLNIGSIVCIRTPNNRLHDVLTILSKGLANSYIDGGHGKLKYEYDPCESKLTLTIWGTAGFQSSLMSSFVEIRKSLL